MNDSLPQGMRSIVGRNAGCPVKPDDGQICAPDGIGGCTACDDGEGNYLFTPCDCCKEFFAFCTCNCHRDPNRSQAQKDHEQRQYDEWAAL